MSKHELDLFQHVAAIAMSMPKESFTEPDDDWAPIAFLETVDGEIGTMPLHPLMGEAVEKDILAEVVIPMAIKEFKAKKVVMILSVWMSDGITKDQMETGDFVQPSKDPNRKEALMLTEYTSDGVCRYSMAPIERHEDSPPTLGEWDDLPEANRYEGRFVDPIIKALKQVVA